MKQFCFREMLDRGERKENDKRKKLSNFRKAYKSIMKKDNNLARITVGLHFIHSDKYFEVDCCLSEKCWVLKIEEILRSQTCDERVTDKLVPQQCHSLRECPQASTWTPAQPRGPSAQPTNHQTTSRPSGINLPSRRVSHVPPKVRRDRRTHCFVKTCRTICIFISCCTQ